DQKSAHHAVLMFQPHCSISPTSLQSVRSCFSSHHFPPLPVTHHLLFRLLHSWENPICRVSWRQLSSNHPATQCIMVPVNPMFHRYNENQAIQPIHVYRTHSYPF